MTLSAEGNSATFTLKPGHYTLDFAAVRKLNFMAYGAQRYVKESDPLPLQGLSAATNRTFDENGKETNGTGTPHHYPPAMDSPSACSAKARFHRKTIGPSS